MSISIEALSQPISDDLPSGENLEYDPEYLEMETLFQTKGESAIEDDQEETGPDWKGIGRTAGSLLERTRDLHVQVYATLASIHTNGLIDFRDNLKLLAIYLGEFWDSVHPQLDPDDDNDPTLRINTMQMLNEHNLVAMSLESAKLVELKGMGQFGVREIEWAQGSETVPEGEEVQDLNVIREAFNQSGGDHIDALVEATEDSLQLLTELDKLWQEKADDPQGLDFSDTASSLKKISGILHEYAPAESATAEEALDAEEGAAGGASAASVSGAVNTRADVIRVIDSICTYYANHEPSSPVPLILRRAQRLVDKSFMEILEDMAPTGMTEAQVISGSKEE